MRAGLGQLRHFQIRRLFAVSASSISSSFLRFEVTFLVGSFFLFKCLACTKQYAYVEHTVVFPFALRNLA